MSTLTIHHRTVYRYSAPMAFGPHRLMLRPRESRALRLHTHELTIAPAAAVTWALDVTGNSVATAVFSEPSDTLTIDSTATLSLDVEPWPVFDIALSAQCFPFLLSQEEMTDLGALRLQAYLDSAGQVRDWAQSFVTGPAGATDTLTLLKDINAGAAAQITYHTRDDGNAQSPELTLTCGRGSCRDVAVLFADAVRSLGFGARIVSGYLYDPDLDLRGSTGSGSTHAWVEVYVPGAGWITFDPTNRSLGGFNLIPVAVARHISQIMPVSGSFAGDPGAFLGLDVTVTVVPADAEAVGSDLPNHDQRLPVSPE